jgi:hypothetical protein
VIVESGEYGGGVDVGRDRGSGMEIVLAHIEVAGVRDYVSAMLGELLRELSVDASEEGVGGVYARDAVMRLRVQITKVIGTTITIRKCIRKGTKYCKVGYRKKDLKIQEEQEIKAGGEADAWRRPFCAE